MQYPAHQPTLSHGLLARFFNRWTCSHHGCFLLSHTRDSRQLLLSVLDLGPGDAGAHSRAAEHHGAPHLAVDSTYAASYSRQAMPAPWSSLTVRPRCTGQSTN